jgi:hypothetical protein
VHQWELNRFIRFVFGRAAAAAAAARPWIAAAPTSFSTEVVRPSSLFAAVAQAPPHVLAVRVPRVPSVYLPQLRVAELADGRHSLRRTVRYSLTAAQTVAAARRAVVRPAVCGTALRGSALCCAVLCCAVLCCAVLCCAVLCCAVLCCAVLC